MIITQDLGDLPHPILEDPDMNKLGRARKPIFLSLSANVEMMNSRLDHAVKFTVLV